MTDEPEFRDWQTEKGLWRRLRPVVRSLRSAPTPAEETLWEALRGARLDGFRFRRQHAVGQFIADFFCWKARLVIEVDGGVHRARQTADQARDDFFAWHGYRVLRFNNDRVTGDLSSVLDEITRALHD